MAEKKEAAAPQEGDAKAGKKKLLIMIGGGVVVLALVLGGVFFFLFSGSSSKPAASGEGETHGEAAAPKPEEAPKTEAFYLDLPEMVVNLISADRSTFVKMNVSLQVSEKNMIDEIQPQLPKVLDAFQLYLRELRLSDLQGSAGLFRLKEELQRRINLAVYPARVDDVLFRSILVQ